MDETKATYGETAELKIMLKNASGESRTITLADPKSDTALTTATAAFAELVLNAETNVFMVNGENPVSMVADLVTTDRTNVGEYGQAEVEPALIVNPLSGNVPTGQIRQREIQGYIADRNYTITSATSPEPSGLNVSVSGQNVVINATNADNAFTAAYVLSDGIRNCYFTVTTIL